MVQRARQDRTTARQDEQEKERKNAEKGEGALAESDDAGLK